MLWDLGLRNTLIKLKLILCHNGVELWDINNLASEKNIECIFVMLCLTSCDSHQDLSIITEQICSFTDTSWVIPTWAVWGERWNAYSLFMTWRVLEVCQKKIVLVVVYPFFFPWIAHWTRVVCCMLGFFWLAVSSSTLKAIFIFIIKSCFFFFSVTQLNKQLDGWLLLLKGSHRGAGMALCIGCWGFRSQPSFISLSWIIMICRASFERNLK